MSAFLKKEVIPRLFRHFDSDPLKERLRMLYAWHANSFEQWFKWECVLALDDVFPWDDDQTQWWLEYPERKKELGVVDMALLGSNTLFLHLKVFIPGGLQRKWIGGSGNSVRSDIEKIQRFRGAPAAAILFLLERPEESIDLEEEGLPPADNAQDPSIELGNVEYAQGRYYHGVRARLLYWSNGI